MNRKLISILVLLLILSTTSIFGDASKSDLYVKTIYIVKVYNDNMGFRVDYQTANMEMHSTYMPQEWFGSSGGYGEVIYGDHPSAPYMSIWYKGDKVDHFRLYVKKHFSDPSWGTFRRTGVSEDQFDVEELTIAYE